MIVVFGSINADLVIQVATLPLPGSRASKSVPSKAFPPML